MSPARAGLQAIEDADPVVVWLRRHCFGTTASNSC
jgi:hypothetical protein